MITVGLTQACPNQGEGDGVQLREQRDGVINGDVGRLGMHSGRIWWQRQRKIGMRVLLFGISPTMMYFHPLKPLI